MAEKRRRTFMLPADTDRAMTDVDAEVDFHIEQKAERLIGEGMGEEEAWAEARRRFGSVENVRSQIARERDYATIAAAWDKLRQDLRYGLRQVTENRVFTAVTVGTLALGIGATTSIFSVVDGIVFRPLPFPQPYELVSVWADVTRQGGPADEWMNFPAYFDLKERSRTLEAVGAWDGGPFTLTGLGEPEEIVVGVVSHDMLSDVLGVEPVVGRGFSASDDEPGAPGIALVTDGFLDRALSGDVDVIGTPLVLDGEAYTIVGILPEGFQAPFMTDAEVWIPLRQSRTENYCGRGGACMRVVARLADGVTLESARTEATEIARRLEEEYPRENTGVGLTVLALRDEMVADARTPLLVLLAAVGLVLLIACVNVANLLMARATSRSPEFAVRSALGAGRGRLTRQLLTESALLALMGGAAGVALALGGTDLLVSLAPPGTPRVDGVAVSGRVLAFASVVTLFAGVVFGVVPSLRSTRADLKSALHEGARRGSGGPAGMRARAALVSGQVALALILLVGAGLLLRSFQNLRAEDLGFRPNGVLTLRIGLPSTRYPDAATRRDFVAGLEERLAALPGVEAVGTTSWLPLTGFGSDTQFNIEGRPLAPPGQESAVWFRRITSGYPEAMGMRLVSGRWISEADDESALRVVVVNEGLARRFFPNEDPLGKRLNLNDPANPVWREIVGVAVEARHFGIRDESRDALYLPYRQSPSSSLFMTLHTEREPRGLSAEVRAAVAEADPLLASSDIRTMESLVADALGPERFVTTLLGLFAGLALLLAVVGLYGVVTYTVSRRLREMGVRLALGAEGRQVGALVLRQSLALVSAGVVLGIAGSVALTRLLDNLLFGISATDPWTYVVVSLVLASVALAASSLPAYRAARVDPIRVMKAE